MVLQHEKKVQREKQSGSIYFLAYCFINLLVNNLFHTAPSVICQWRNALEKISTTSHFRSTFAVTIEVIKYNEPENVSGICCTAVGDHVLQALNFCDNFCSFCITYEVYLEPLWPSCGHCVSSNVLRGQPNGFKFCYTRSNSVETWSSSNIVFSWLHFFPILLNLMWKTGFKESGNRGLLEWSGPSW